MAIYCIACPKCCFGSCPTVYVQEGNDFVLKSELFSECISKQLESDDIDLVKQNITNGELDLKITNEALETHYINKFEMAIARHPNGTKIFPEADGKLCLFRNFEPPLNAINKEGKNIISLLNKDDSIYYRSGMEKIESLKVGPFFDFIDLKFNYRGYSKIKMLLKYRNILLSTTLLYDIVLGSQGMRAINWVKKMDEDSLYAAQFKFIYETFSGIKVKTLINGEWQYVRTFKDAGPINWKYAAIELPVDGSGFVNINWNLYRIIL